MKKQLVITSTAVLLLSVYTLPAQAESAYFAASIGKINSSVGGGSDYDTSNVFAKVGKQLTPNLAVEGVLGIGIQSDKWSDACDSQEVSTDSFLGAQLVGSIDLSSSVSFHGTVGLMQTSATLKNAGSASCYGLAWSEEYSDDDTDLTYGIGADFKFGSGHAITADYQVFYDNEYAPGVDLTVSGLMIGYKKSF